MAKATVIANKLVLQTEYKISELKAVEKHQPSALTLKDEDNKEYFKVATASNEGTVGKYGVSFASESTTTHKAIVEVTIPEGVENVSDWAVEEYGSIIANLVKVENQVGEALRKISADKETVKQLITIV